MPDVKIVVFIDDETHNIRVMKRAFTSRNKWFLHAFQSPQEALDLIDLGRITPDLVITDHYMPVIQGYELLKQIHKTHPRSFRVLTSANEDIIEKISQYNEFQCVVNAVLFKPWSRDRIDEILKLYEDQLQPI